MAEFEEAMALLAKLEGGKDVSQRLNPSNYGITLQFLKGIGGIAGDINLDGIIDRRDLVALTPDKAADLFHRYFWDALDLGQLESQAIANKTLDLAVNVGPVHATKLIQQSLRDLHHPVAVDGLMGDHTRNALNTVDPTDFLAHLRKHAAEYYKMLANHFPALMKQLAGWLNRVVA